MALPSNDTYSRTTLPVPSLRFQSDMTNYVITLCHVIRLHVILHYGCFISLNMLLLCFALQSAKVYHQLMPPSSADARILDPI
ncbi:hypothetical protein T12_11185 [Trichinella patagoniensis]|uniref:Uncharacterized protein n=1 Tax=Trichinella patagoniensis TaxID=990121 RepID=A0A0V0Z4D6_9BILA|nr:hypothetical protein T12_11185 [Trichinella patagoniensis]